jgi:hypothetical protein
MSVDVLCEIVIDRPRADVAAFMFDPARDALWTTGVVESRPLTPGLLHKGSRVERISKFLGRRFGYLVEVVDASEARFVDMAVTKPFPMTIRYELDDDAGGAGGSLRTVARIRARGEPGGFFKLAGPLLSPMVKGNIDKDLRKLKECLESAAAGP